VSKTFQQRMQEFEPTVAEASARRWIYVPYDRLHEGVGPLGEAQPQEVVLVFMESIAKGTRRPYHKKKLTLVLSAMRHFALEQAERGCRVVYGASPTSFAEGLRALQDRWAWRELVVNRPAERELRVELEQAKSEGLRLLEVKDTAWLSTSEDFEKVFGKTIRNTSTLGSHIAGSRESAADSVPAQRSVPRSGVLGRKYLMDTFYRAMRQKTGVLMRAGKPVGGKFSYDAENRKPYRGEVPVPQRPAFAPDEITREVMAMIEQRHPDTFGSLAGFDLAVTRRDAEAVWAFALEHLLPHFGPFEDAMSTAHPDLFHSMTSPLLNLTLLRPQQLVEDVAEAAESGHVPLASAEGFIRQVLGWREFMRHIHEATDGYRTLAPTAELLQGASPNHLDANRKLPPVYWGTTSGMRCMDTVVAGVVADGWSHHITRLMVLSNLATLCGFSSRELTDWFWFGYVDAYDWVVEPNVLGMATFADGGLTATKPYVSGAAYINKMSDFCGKCALNPKLSLGEGSCPFTSMYWSFLERNEAKLAPLNRMAMPLATMRKKTAGERAALRERAAAAVEALEKGEIVR
jgi:deoxyribodipyrimidine photolyase-related protein